VPYHADWEADVYKYPQLQQLEHIYNVKIGLIARNFCDFGEIQF
jgi:hypothetical protein